MPAAAVEMPVILEVLPSIVTPCHFLLPATLATWSGRRARRQALGAPSQSRRGHWWNTDRSFDKGSAVTEGTVRWFDADRGFGFIALGQEAEDVYVHASEIVSGDACDVTCRTGSDGPRDRAANSRASYRL
jgi:cold shock CspA family protein